MNQLLHKIVSVSMALLVLLSTLSITIEKHYCANNLVDVAVFSKAKTCCAATADSNKESKEKGCCSNETDLIVGQDELSLQKVESLEAPQQVFLFSFAYVFGGLNIQKSQIEPLFEQYSPPKLFQDIHVLNEVFII